MVNKELRVNNSGTPARIFLMLRFSISGSSISSDIRSSPLSAPFFNGKRSKYILCTVEKALVGMIYRTL